MEGGKRENADQMAKVTIRKANGIYKLMDVECKMMRYISVLFVTIHFHQMFGMVNVR